MLSAFGVEAVASEGGQITWRGARASQGGIHPAAVPWEECIDWNCKSCCLSSLPWCASRGQPQSHVTPLTLADNVPRFPCLADVQKLPDKTDYSIQHDSIECQLHLNPLEQGQLDSKSDKWFWPSEVTLDLRHASVDQAHIDQTGFSHSILITCHLCIFGYWSDARWTLELGLSSDRTPGEEMMKYNRYPHCRSCAQ